ncbi:hypothetical protein Poli38472_001878 [Pythium oligandrum]|uniref:Protein kinase domain-containing protein n=1 Tax=Pythium oligandrum TaxID=41045 RepID=A0A8K1FS67_PYTOL|nr:hypothetical protein Poli38472_001878 [Pythium oligandrum]|eukprot:TMW69722.1 hypothetical protein Poli38472_001878 [Pythium oligandrum]
MLMLTKLFGLSDGEKFRKAAERGNISRVKTLLDEGIDVDAIDKNGDTALHRASPYGHADVVRELLGRGVNPSRQNENGDAPLAMCLQLKGLQRLSYSKSDLLWNSLETVHALMSCGVARAATWETVSNCCVFKNGLKAVETYLAEFDASDKNDLIWRRKVCVVGSSKSGKTSLIRSITSMAPTLEKEDDRTIGVDLFRLDFTEDVNTIEQRSHAVTFWDFAGQDEYHVAHTLSYSRRTLYLLCVDVEEFDQVVRQAHACEDYDEAESLVSHFVQDRVWCWFRSIFARQPDAEFALIATKTDALGSDANSRLKYLEGELIKVVKELKKTHSSEIQREIKALHELSVEGNEESSSILRINSLQHLQYQLEGCVPNSWIGLNVNEPSSVQHARTSITDVVKQSDRSFLMPDTYSRVLHVVEALREEAGNATTKDRIRQSFLPLPDLVEQLMDAVQDLTEDEAVTILETLHDLGDVLWYARDGHHMLGNTIILDAELLIDFIRQIVCHDPAKISGANSSGDDQTNPLIQAMNQHGTVSNELLRYKFSWWKRLAYPDQLLQFKQLLQHFNLAYPAGGDVMQAGSDLIVPAYWRFREKQIDLDLLEPLSINDNDLSQTRHFLWVYDLGNISADVVTIVFEQLVVRSYFVFSKRVIYDHCVESVQEGRLTIRIACGMVGQMGPVIRLEVLGKEQYDPSGWLRDVHEAIEAVLKMFPGILVTRKAVSGHRCCNLDDCIPKWRALSDNQREAHLHEHSWLPNGVIEWFRRTDGGVRSWYISPESIEKRDGPAFAVGGFGKAYLDKWQHTDVVEKEISELEMRRFLGEVTLWCELRHPNVVQFLGANDQKEPYFIVSAYATKGDLMSILANEKKNGRDVMWQKLYEAAAGLSHLHRRGIVHGDLKGDNILVNESGTAMLVDFGLSFNESGSHLVATELKDSLGAMAWRAPEFVNPTKVRPTHKSDVYSLGMCIIEAVTGEKPWGKCVDNHEIRECLLNGEVKVAKPEAMTDAQWELVKQMISPLPTDRPDLNNHLQTGRICNGGGVPIRLA